MMDFDSELDPHWQAGVLVWMANVCIQVPEPDELMDDWLNEAGAGDEQYINWALDRWKALSCMGVWELEHVLRQARTWQRAHPDGVRNDRADGLRGGGRQGVRSVRD